MTLTSKANATERAAAGHVGQHLRATPARSSECGALGIGSEDGHFPPEFAIHYRKKMSDTAR
jgi:hypothetical protein